MNQNELIDHLVQDLKPFKPWLAWQVLLMIGLFCLGIYGAVLVWWVDVRPDWLMAAKDIWTIAECVLLLILVGLALRIGIVAYAPDAYQMTLNGRLPRLLFGVLLAFVAIESVARGTWDDPTLQLSECACQLGYGMAIPALLVFWMLRRGDVSHRQRFVEAICWTMSAVSALVLKLSCDINGLIHLCGAHYLPMIPLVWLGCKAARRIMTANVTIEPQLSNP